MQGDDVVSNNGSITWANERRKLRDLVPWEHNPRQINTREAERLGDSLKEFGQIQTVAIGPDGELYDGHQRRYVWAALPKFGPDYEVDVRVSSRALTDKERQKLVVYLHRGTMGDWDWDELANTFEVPELLEWGFEESELQLDWGNDATPDPGAQVDKAAELQEKWQVERGQIWQVGRHRVVCGDSTCAEDVGRLMGGVVAALCASDPPYNVGQEYGEAVDDEKAESEYASFSAAWFLEWQQVSERQIVTPGCVNLARWLRWIEPYHVAPWTKTNAMTNGKVSRWWCWEPMLFFGEAWKRARTNDVFDFPVPPQKAPGMGTLTPYHPCPKPLKMWVDLVENYSEPGEAISDAFCGSGTTLVACEQTGRVGYGMEIEPKYVAVTLERLAGMGLEPQLIEQ